MKLTMIAGAMLAAAGLSGCATSKLEMMGNREQELHPESFYLPNPEASSVVTVATNGPVAANTTPKRIIILETFAPPRRPPRA